jgi:hypothetical protein
LRGRDLGAVLGVPSRASLAEEADPDETCNGQRKDKRYWCDLPTAHGPNSWEKTIVLLSPPPGEAVG